MLRLVAELNKEPAADKPWGMTVARNRRNGQGSYRTEYCWSPLIDDADLYIDKLAEIIKANNLNSLTVIHMQVPCCSGLTYIAKRAIEQAAVELPFKDVTIGLHGDVLQTETI